MKSARLSTTFADLQTHPNSVTKFRQKSKFSFYNDENLPNNKNNCSRFVPNFFRYHRKCSWKRFPKTFAKVAKFFQSCSNYIKGTQKRLLGHYLQYIISVQKGSNQSAVDHQAIIRNDISKLKITQKLKLTTDEASIR